MKRHFSEEELKYGVPMDHQLTTPAAPGADAMDDETLIARLREPSTLQVYCHQAADRLLSLREENARLRGALTELVIVFPDPSNFKSDIERARAALAPTQRKE